MKTKLPQILIYIFAPLFSFILIGASMTYQSQKTCSKVNISIEYKGENFFLDVFSVRKLIGADESILGAPIEEVQLTKVEKTLMETNYVSKVNAYYNFDGVLFVQIWLKNPIARIMNNNGQSFYLNEERKKIPISETFSARTILVRGNFKEDYLSSDTLRDSVLIQTLPFIEKLSKDEFWSAYISELKIDQNGKIIIYPTVGEMIVKFGTTENYESKLQNLQAFFENVAPKVGWNKYKSISVEFKNQIIGVKKIIAR